MAKLKVNNIVLGEGKPKVCVPLVGKNRDEILEYAGKIKIGKADLIEFRSDYLAENDEIFPTLKEVKKILPDMPLIFTFRSQNEGGSRNIPLFDYLELCLKACESGLVDIVDVELFSGEEIVREVVVSAKRNNVKTIISSHEFDKTPAEDEIVERIKLMESYGGDLLKIAVMPKTNADVITLMGAVISANAQVSRPIVAMSMGELGKVSRVAGEMFGSVISFGSIGKASAPGQIEVNKLYAMLNEFTLIN